MAYDNCVYINVYKIQVLIDNINNDSYQNKQFHTGNEFDSFMYLSVCRLSLLYVTEWTHRVKY